ncbi:hypothetical protein H0H92_011327, partial [Tricholoma furcatifolium]
SYAEPTGIFPDGTVAFISAKAQLDNENIIYMDAYRIEPFGGDVEDEEYRAPIPNLIFPLMFVVGHVVGIEKENKIQHVHM